MSSFFNSPHCKPGGIYCQVCRLRGDSAHRAALLKKHPATPADSAEFDCPKGVPWGWTPGKPLKAGALRRAVQTTKRAARRAVHAGKSTAKTAAGIDRATKEQVAARLSICARCPGGHVRWKKGQPNTCGPMLASLARPEDAGGGCGCLLKQKARDVKENCPEGYWPRVEASG